MKKLEIIKIIKEEIAGVLGEKTELENLSPELKEFVDQVHKQSGEEKPTQSIGIIQHKLKIHGFYDGEKYKYDETNIKKLKDAVAKVQKFGFEMLTYKKKWRPDRINPTIEKLGKQIENDMSKKVYGESSHTFIHQYLGSLSKKDRLNLTQTDKLSPDSSSSVPQSAYLKKFEDEGYPVANKSKKRKTVNKGVEQKKEPKKPVKAKITNGKGMQELFDIGDFKAYKFNDEAFIHGPLATPDFLALKGFMEAQPLYNIEGKGIGWFYGGRAHFHPLSAQDKRFENVLPVSVQIPYEKDNEKHQNLKKMKSVTSKSSHEEDEANKKPTVKASNPQSKSELEKPKAKTILEQLPPGNLIGKVHDISVFGRKGYKVKFYNSEPGFLEVNGDGIIRIQLPNNRVREFKLKKVMFANFAKAEKTSKNRLKIYAKIGPKIVKGSLNAKQLDELVKVCLGDDAAHTKGLAKDASKKSKVGEIEGQVVRTK